MISTTDIIVMAVVATVVGGYIVTSIILFFYPRLLHKKKDLKFRPLHISHRGGAGENLENTMAAFQHAKDLGTEMLELDCHLTKDGQVVVAHDGSLKRICGVEAEIPEFTYKDLPKIKSSLTLDFYQKSFMLKGGEDRQIPLLKDIFTAFPDLPINVDIKTDNDELIDKVNRLIIEHQRESITGWGNRSNTVADKLYKLNPDIPLIFSFKRVLILLLAFYTGVLPFLPLKESLFEVIMPSIVYDEKKKYNLGGGLKIVLKILDTLMMRPALFKHLEKRGIQVYLWVLNSDEEFERALKLGATGIMTDFPTLLKDHLDKTNDVKTSSKYGSYHSINDS